MERTILISGAAGGLGSSLAVACASAGAQTLLIDKNLRGLEAVCDQIEALGAPAPGYCQLDLAVVSPDDIHTLLADFVSTYGGIDSLVHCAARFQGLQPLDQVSGTEWLESMQINVNTAWLLSVASLPYLRKAENGSLIFTLDQQAASGSAYWGPYGIAKAALKSMTTMFSEELENTQCSVVGIEPGAMRTDLRASAYLAEDPSTQPSPEAAARVISDFALGRERPGQLFVGIT